MTCRGGRGALALSRPRQDAFGFAPRQVAHLARRPVTSVVRPLVRTRRHLDAAERAACFIDGLWGARTLQSHAELR